jgi:hypothetical protein
MLKLEKVLPYFGYTESRANFLQILKDVFFVMSASSPMTQEDLEHNLGFAAQYVNAVRGRTVSGIPDFVILRSLQNLRKKGDLTPEMRNKWYRDHGFPVEDHSNKERQNEELSSPSLW